MRICESKSRAPNPPPTPRSHPFAISCQNPDHEKKKWKTSMALPHAKDSGRRYGRLTLEAFQRSCAKKTGDLKKQQSARESSSSSPSRAITRAQGAR